MSKMTVVQLESLVSGLVTRIDELELGLKASNGRIKELEAALKNKNESERHSVNVIAAVIDKALEIRKTSLQTKPMTTSPAPAIERLSGPKVPGLCPDCNAPEGAKHTGKCKVNPNQWNCKSCKPGSPCDTHKGRGCYHIWNVDHCERCGIIRTTA